MKHVSPEALSKAVAAICPDIQEHVGRDIAVDERSLWFELSVCILSSNVPYSLAVAVANAVDAKRLLHGKRLDQLSLVRELQAVLRTPVCVDGKPRAYRFPVLRAEHLASTHAAVSAVSSSLCGLLSRFHSPEEARMWLVKNAPGLGLKQASMFLRNTGKTYDLAILDRHVLNYMSALGMYSGARLSISGSKEYHRLEIVLRGHAESFDCPVGLLDWAIWIVMRVANREKELQRI